MKKKLILIYLLFYWQFNCMAYAQQQSKITSTPQNLGISFNLIGLFFGEYNLGVYTFLDPFLQIGLSTTYFSSDENAFKLEGWQVETQINYFFSTWRRSGFYLGGTGGIESVDLKKDSNSDWQHYKDLTWSFIPGYAWVLDSSFMIMFGLGYGYNLGDIQFIPRIGINFFF